MAYLKYMTTVGSLLGGQDSNFTREQMKEVLKFEMKLAKVCLYLICSWVDNIICMHAGIDCAIKNSGFVDSHICSVQATGPLIFLKCLHVG